MAFKIPDVLRYEIRHRLENLGGGTTEGGVRGWINAHPLLAAGVAAVSAVSLIVVLTSSLWSRSDAPRTQAKTVWFCDANTGKLFTASPICGS